MIKKIQTTNAPQSIGPYSQAIVSNRLIFCSGQVGIDTQKNIVLETIEEQTHQIMKNLQTILKEAGSDLQYVVKITIYLTDIDNFSKVNEIYGQYFGETKPARSTIEVSQLPKGSYITTPLIEIDAIAIEAT